MRTAILAPLVILPTSSAFAETLCRCAYPTLEATLCGDDLTTKVFVWSGYTDGQTGNNVYCATVQQVFHGDTGRVITIEAPHSCGFELRSWTSYGVSMSRDSHGRYTTFAYGSWVKPWREVTREERGMSAPRARRPRTARGFRTLLCDFVHKYGRRADCRAAPRIEGGGHEPT